MNMEEINTTRERLEAVYGIDNVWNTDEVQEKFEIMGFFAPFVSVIRKSDRQKGTLTFIHMPRFYYDFKPN